MSELKNKLTALVGTPYDDPRFVPTNCWGFVRYCYALAGIELPEDVRLARKLQRAVRNKPRQLLDVVYFKDFLEEERHVGVCLDNIYVLQSSKTTNGVAALRLNRPGVHEAVQGTYRLK